MTSPWLFANVMTSCNLNWEGKNPQINTSHSGKHSGLCCYRRIITIRIIITPQRGFTVTTQTLIIMIHLHDVCYSLYIREMVRVCFLHLFKFTCALCSQSLASKSSVIIVYLVFNLPARLWPRPWLFRAIPVLIGNGLNRRKVYKVVSLISSRVEHI